MFSFLFGSTKYRTVSTGQYISFTTKEKLKYHKHNGREAERIPYTVSLPTVIRKVSEYIISTHLNQEENKSSFTIILGYDGSVSSNVHSAFPQIYWERPDGEIIGLRAHNNQGISSASISTKEGAAISFMVGEDNVIEWLSRKYKGVAEMIIEQLYKEVKDLGLL